MPSFILKDRDIIQSSTAKYLTQGILFNTIHENNQKFEIMRDESRMGWVIYCDEKPRDMPIYGIFWRDLDAR